MEEVSPEILVLAARLIRYVGGIDNINGITSGKDMLLSISVHHMEQVQIKRIEKISSISEIIFGATWMTVLLEGIYARDVVMAIKLYEKEEAGKTEEELLEPDRIVDRIFSFLQNVFMPLLSALIAIGILQSIMILIMSFGLTSHLYSDEAVLTTISGAIFSFIPLMTAFSLARCYGTNPYIAVTVAGLLLHPAVITFINETILGDILKLYVPAERFSSSILPILFIVPFQAWLDKLLDGKLSDSFLSVVKPFLLLGSSTAIGILFFGPILIFLGNALLAGSEMLTKWFPWFMTFFIGAFGPILVMAGAHYSFFPLMTASLQNNGYETMIGPGMLVMNAAHAGVALAVVIQTRKKLYRTYSGTAFVLALLGVSQPALYGVEILLKKPFLYTMIAGGAGGLFAGLMGVKAYGFVNPGVATLFQFKGESGNLFAAILGMLIAFLTGFILTWRAALPEPTDSDLKIAMSGNRDSEKRGSL